MGALWILDTTHSEITFKVRHMMISNVKGNFNNFSASIESESNTFENAKILAKVKVDSIDTNNADRDTHLKGQDFFDSEKYPDITFGANSLNGDVSGNLTIHGVTKPVNLIVDFGGVNVDPWGNTKAGFSFEGKIMRSDFGLNWNAALETGGVLVSDEVKIAGELQFVKQP